VVVRGRCAVGGGGWWVVKGAGRVGGEWWCGEGGDLVGGTVTIGTVVISGETLNSIKLPVECRYNLRKCSPLSASVFTTGTLSY
jgi:hypothetical protein